MAYYGRRSGYRNGYRRKSLKGLFKILTVVIFVVSVFVAVIQTMNVQKISASKKKIQEQVLNLQKKLETVKNYVPVSVLDGSSEAAMAYQKLYPEMKTERPKTVDEIDKRAIYLTFENGPSSTTKDILNYLKEKGQKATFFITGENIDGNEEILKRIVNEGHTIGACGYSTDYKSIYESVETFLADFNKVYNAIYKACGVYPAVYRFPLGSINEYNGGIYRETIAEMTRRGFVYFDWNINTQDNRKNKNDWEAIVQEVSGKIKKVSQVVVLMHDGEENNKTARAVKYMLNYFAKNGYYFGALKPTTQSVSFDYFGE